MTRKPKVWGSIHRPVFFFFFKLAEGEEAKGAPSLAAVFSHVLFSCFSLLPPASRLSLWYVPTYPRSLPQRPPPRPLSLFSFSLVFLCCRLPRAFLSGMSRHTPARCPNAPLSALSLSLFSFSLAFLCCRRSPGGECWVSESCGASRSLVPHVTLRLEKLS